MPACVCSECGLKSQRRQPPFATPRDNQADDVDRDVLADLHHGGGLPSPGTNAELDALAPMETELGHGGYPSPRANAELDALAPLTTELHHGGLPSLGTNAELDALAPLTTELDHVEMMPSLPPARGTPTMMLDEAEDAALTNIEIAGEGIGELELQLSLRLPTTAASARSTRATTTERSLWQQLVDLSSADLRLNSTSASNATTRLSGGSRSGMCARHRDFWGFCILVLLMYFIFWFASELSETVERWPAANSY